MRVGLLGGSFNPPHAAHRAISLFALKRLKLDRVWWLLSPGNPLKEHNGLRTLIERERAARDVAEDPRIDVSCLEAVIGTRYTVDTITHLRRRVSGVRFVWIMGADNLAQFERWHRWREIFIMLPVVVVDRPGWRLKAMASKAARAFAATRVAMGAVPAAVRKSWATADLSGDVFRTAHRVDRHRAAAQAQPIE